MRRWLLVVIPTVALALAIVRFESGIVGWIAAGAVALAGVSALSWFVFDPNSSYWARTVWRAPRPINAVALTFDDGPDPAFTPEVLGILGEKKVPAAFFVVGDRVRENAGIVQEIDRAGHLVGNHSTFHDLGFHFRFWRRLRREVDECNARIRAAIGKEPLLFRSPQGFKSPWLGDVLRERGMTAVGWQVRGRDAFARDPAAIARRVIEGARPGGVVTLHDGAGLGGTRDRRPTIEALPLVIDGLRERGLDLVRLDELLALPGYRQEAAEAEGTGKKAPIFRKEKVAFVEETKLGTLFIRTPTWTHYVIRVAIYDLERMIPERRERYPAILDVGCGHGASFRLLEERFKPDRIVGVDAHLESLERAAEAAARCASEVELHCVSAAETGLPDASFDMIFCHQAFHHLQDHETAAREFFRLLKPGGVLLFAESTRAYIHSLMIRVFFRHPMDVQKSADEYVALLQGTGFEVRPECVSLPYLWWSRWDLGTFEFWGFPPAKDREDTLVNAVAVRP
jgi:peptidoglycan/xylan/chitin deacetylase (PgdA/CDA1 family)/SAM-dependent methyltransferase